MNYSKFCLQTQSQDGSVRFYHKLASLFTSPTKIHLPKSTQPHSTLSPSALGSICTRDRQRRSDHQQPESRVIAIISILRAFIIYHYFMSYFEMEKASEGWVLRMRRTMMKGWIFHQPEQPFCILKTMAKGKEKILGSVNKFSIPSSFFFFCFACSFAILNKREENSSQKTLQTRKKASRKDMKTSSRWSEWILIIHDFFCHLSARAQFLLTIVIRPRLFFSHAAHLSGPEIN